MMRVMAISGSPIANGNTEAALHVVLEGCRAGGAETEFVRLYERVIAPCRSCVACMKTGCCAIRDDGRELVERLRGMDVVVFGTPVYWYHVSGALKNAVDRTYCTFHNKGLAGKRVAALLVQHCDGAEQAVELFHRWCRDQCCQLVDTVTISTGSRPGAVTSDSDLLARLRALGADLVRKGSASP